MTQTVVATDGLTKRYGTRAAVDGVTLEVRRGEVYGFLGPNGAGKTTTLRMLLGLVRPTAGTASVLGHPPVAPDALRRVGALVEGPGFYPYLSGRQNLRVLARYRGLDDRAADRALDRVDLAARGKDRFRTYSLGMKQRLGVAAALLGDPDLLILDEPTNGLDPAGMAAMRMLVVDVAAGGQTVLLSSHLLAEVQQICERVGVVADGRLLHQGTVDQMRGGSVLEVRAAPVAVAARVVSRVAGVEVTAGLDDHGHEVLTVPAAGVDVPELARNLVHEGVDLHTLVVRERALEEVFLSMTGVS
ncbi:ABC transporter ATP-binding protein [Virgisporangium aurantiacum]